ncbi:hypothetical protein M758_5G084400 [Ceratodon purpureus]|nr:hypothetical protein M758_5G084400 [Ceratodon purpureus]
MCIGVLSSFECWCTDWFWLSSDLSTVMDQFDIAAWERFSLSLFRLVLVVPLRGEEKPPAVVGRVEH